MRRNGPGLGSALAVLVFSVLCLTVFATMSLSTALGDKALADAAARTAVSYYEADALAECVLAEILEESGKSGTIPNLIQGVPVTAGENGIVTFSCPISENKELYVETTILEGRSAVLKWLMRDTGKWQADTNLPVWSGE